MLRQLNMEINSLNTTAPQMQEEEVQSKSSLEYTNLKFWQNQSHIVILLISIIGCLSRDIFSKFINGFMIDVFIYIFASMDAYDVPGRTQVKLYFPICKPSFCQFFPFENCLLLRIIFWSAGVVQFDSDKKKGSTTSVSLGTFSFFVYKTVA